MDVDKTRQREYSVDFMDDVKEDMIVFIQRISFKFYGVQK